MFILHVDSPVVLEYSIDAYRVAVFFVCFPSPAPPMHLWAPEVKKIKNLLCNSADPLIFIPPNKKKPMISISDRK